VVIEPRAGGRWFERGVDGSECDWGRVLLWDAPNRVMLMWQLSAQFQLDRSIETEVDVRFTAIDARHHAGRSRAPRPRCLRRRRGRRCARPFSSPNGWNGMLEHYAAGRRHDRSGARLAWPAKASRRHAARRGHCEPWPHQRGIIRAERSLRPSQPRSGA
jgi:hypothetical protein